MSLTTQCLIEVCDEKIEISIISYSNPTNNYITSEIEYLIDSFVTSKTPTENQTYLDILDHELHSDQVLPHEQPMQIEQTIEIESQQQNEETDIEFINPTEVVQQMC